MNVAELQEKVKSAKGIRSLSVQDLISVYVYYDSNMLQMKYRQWKVYHRACHIEKKNEITEKLALGFVNWFFEGTKYYNG